MEIASQKIGDFVEVTAKGRLDGYWSDHLSRALEDILREGNDRIRINLSEVNYISSLGVRVLVVFYKKLKAIEGAFVVVEPSLNVRKVLDMVGLRATLMDEAPAVPAKHSRQPVASARELERGSVKFKIFDFEHAGEMSCRVVGDPGLLEGCRFGEDDCRTVLFPEFSFGIGLGAFGQTYADSRDRFGEFLAAAGAVAYQPSDGSNVPDFLITEGAFVPELKMLYGAVCEGSFDALARFDTKADAAAVGLTELAEGCLEITKADRAWIILVAESAGLVGASLRRSPGSGATGDAPFGHPQIRDWLSFTTERAHPRATVLVVGMAARSSSGHLGPMLRPLRGSSSPWGHFHAAAFRHRPLQRGQISLKKTVLSLFEGDSLLGILHLIGDDRGSTGVSESEFVRGACWIGPIKDPE